MNESDNSLERYPLPFTARSKYKIEMHLCFIFIIILFAGGAFIPDPMPLKIIFAALGLFLAYSWLYIGIFRRSYLKIDNNGVMLKSMFGTRKVCWGDIENVNTYYASHNTYIGIVTNEKLKKQKYNFWALLYASMGGIYYMAIPLKTFASVDSEKLFSTISYYAGKHDMNSCLKDHTESKNNAVERHLNINAGEDVLSGSNAKAVLKAFLASVLVGVLYGASIWLFRTNIVLIAFIGLAWVLYLYNMNYCRKTVNVLTRISLGICCALPFLIAPITAILLLSGDIISQYGFMATVNEAFKYLVHYPYKLLTFYILAVIFFVAGFTIDMNIKALRKIKRVFLKKHNGFYIEKDKLSISIYTADYENYNENDEKIEIDIMPDNCLAEMKRKNLCAFYIPSEIIMKHDIRAHRFNMVDLNGENYFKLDFGRHGKLKPYGYECSLILNMNRELEVVQLGRLIEK